MEGTNSTRKRDVVTQLFRAPVIDMLRIEVLDLIKTRGKNIDKERQCQECQAPVFASV